MGSSTLHRVQLVVHWVVHGAYHLISLLELFNNHLIITHKPHMVHRPQLVHPPL